MSFQPKMPPMQLPKNQRLQEITTPSSVGFGLETDVVTGAIMSCSDVVVASPLCVGEA